MKKICFLSLLACSSCGSQAALYVNPQSGCDDNKGTASEPFASLEKARDTIRSLKKSGALAEKGIAVELSGTFAMPTNTFVLDAYDGGSATNAPVVYRAAKPGALFVGGHVLPAPRPAV